MMEQEAAKGQAVLDAIAAESFIPLGWFRPDPADGVPNLGDGAPARTVLLIGNAGPAMFERFASARDPSVTQMDDWCLDILPPIAERFGARAVFPFDVPALPFLTWARRARTAFVSPLGLNMHPVYGLWHAFRAALLFAEVLDLPEPDALAHPCETCIDKPCLSSCPVSAFTNPGYNVDACAGHLSLPDGTTCRSGGCLARLACPYGRDFHYSAQQTAFHMEAFVRTRANFCSKPGED